MFEFVGKHKRLLQFLLALILVPPFAFFGIQSFDRVAGGSRSAPRSTGARSRRRSSPVPSDQQRDQLRAALGRNFDPALLDTPEARKQLLDGLVGRRVLGLYVARNGMARERRSGARADRDRAGVPGRRQVLARAAIRR